MKILRSKGMSFTRRVEIGANKSDALLSRGLVTKSKSILTPRNFEGVEEIEPSRLADYVGEDYALILRQTVAILDKVIRKPKSLRAFNVEAYVDRTLLAAELWGKLCERCEGTIKELENGQGAFTKFTDSWNSKVHPYARTTPDTVNPLRDGNATYIRDFGDQEKKRSDFAGRWHKAFWRVASGRPAYAEMAELIFKHLFIQEYTIAGEIRQDDGRAGTPTKKGLIESRGLSIKGSANDPRVETADPKTGEWNLDDFNRYFGEDIAKIIFDDLVEYSKTLREARSRNERVRAECATRFGSLLYVHFGRTRPTIPADDKAKTGFWSVHNVIRQFYQQLAKSDRLAAAMLSESGDELRKVAPADKGSLQKILAAKDRNISVSELIRIGKLIVHASDMPESTEEASAIFKLRMDQLVESDGQSEIKRNEAFTRVWRNAVAFSSRTLKGWVDPKDQAKVGSKGKINDDLLTAGVAEEALRLLDVNQFDQHLGLIFGNKEFNGRSRASLFRSKDTKSKKELMRALLNVARELRNRTNHFSTKRRLSALIRGGILEGSDEAVASLRELLAFDREVQKNIIADDLNQLKVSFYVPGALRKDLLDQLSSFPEGTEILVPRFMSVLIRVRDLAENESVSLEDGIRPFASLKLDKLNQATDSLNRCRIGLLRGLYISGFQRWLEENKNNTELVRRCVAGAVHSKEARSEAYQKERGQFYVMVETVAGSLALESVGDLDALFRQLMSHAAAAERLNQTYRPDASTQKKVANWVDDLRRDITAYLFGSYLASTRLDWIFSLPEPVPEHDGVEAIRPEEITLKGDLTTNGIESWHAQFYAWLYLLPNDAISLLRHQLLKSAVLEGKGAQPEAESQAVTLAQMDWLMGLNLRVESAGFDGNEHLAEDLKASLYEDPGQFENVSFDESTAQNTTLAGTRRGLRQLLRYGHYDVLEGIFKKHKITKTEVVEFTKVDSAKVKNIGDEWLQARKDARALAKEKKPDPALLKVAADCYRKAAVEAALHNFQVNAVRLAEHARLHQIMMRIVGRLTDFTLTWERDRAYLFLGMLYRQIGGDQFQVVASPSRKMDLVGERQAQSPCRIGIKLPGSLRGALRDEYYRRFPNASPANLEFALSIDDANSGFLSLWCEGKGFALEAFDFLGVLLTPEHKAWFDRYFNGPNAENPKDIEAARQRELKREPGKTFNPRVSQYAMGKQQIRNDFAHFNVISMKVRRNRQGDVEAKERDRINLGYLVNAVRSLLSYDRKLKNAVSLAVADILLDEGLVISWTLHEDRLTKPLVLPYLETHLTMARAPDLRWVQFKLPQASVRMTSMVKALFSFDTGGYRMPVAEGEKKKCKGPLKYPRELWEKHGLEIPQAMFVSYPELQESRK